MRIEFDPAEMLREGMAQNGTDFLRYFAYVLDSMSADSKNGATQCSSYLRMADAIERLAEQESK